MTWLRIVLLLVAGLLAAVGQFPLAAVALSAAYVILSFQYEAVCKDLADTDEFVERFMRGDE